MNNVTRSIFRAIHEGKWLSIEYKNQQTQQTKYWVAVKGLNPRTRPAPETADRPGPDHPH